jgi:Asp-tRNA(Asn)/Glu-tRNA(Gln) amidotransferase A subunit family amidase
MLDWRTTSVVSVARELSRGALAARQTVAASLRRIGELEGEIGAWQHLDEEHARTQARHCDTIPPSVDRPLHAIPIGVKDIFDTADISTSYGSAVYAGHHPPADATCVALARAAGAIILGKTVTTEFAGTAAGKTRNPNMLSHTPGGSSSGSAAAVAVGMVPLAIGSQTAGSTIRPAAYCGVVGFKPSFGLIDRTGMKPLAQSLDTVGLFARSVEDVALFGSVLSGRRELAAAHLGGAPRVALYVGAQGSRFSPSALLALDQAARTAAAGGAKVLELPVWHRERQLLAAHETIMCWEVPQALAFERLFRREQLQPCTRELLDRPIPALDKLDAARILVREAQDRLDELFGDCDAIVTPAALGPAPAGLASTGDASQNSVWTLLRTPAVCIPAFVSDGGLPVGLQLIARPSDDIGALAVAAWMEQGLHSSAPKRQSDVAPDPSV